MTRKDVVQRNKRRMLVSVVSKPLFALELVTQPKPSQFIRLMTGHVDV
jgi:hypothetical protein